MDCKQLFTALSSAAPCNRAIYSCFFTSVVGSPDSAVKIQASASHAPAEVKHFRNEKSTTPASLHRSYGKSPATPCRSRPTKCSPIGRNTPWTAGRCAERRRGRLPPPRLIQVGLGWGQVEANFGTRCTPRAIKFWGSGAKMGPTLRPSASQERSG